MGLGFDLVGLDWPDWIGVVGTRVLEILRDARRMDTKHRLLHS